MTIGAKVSVSDVKLSVGISVRDARVDTAYVLPAAAISYILLQTHAELDTTNKNPFTADSVVVLDQKMIALAKVFNEALATTDVIGKRISKPFYDNFAMSDSVTTLLIYIRNFSDAFGVSDAVVLQALKNLSDSITLTEVLSKNFSKLITDGFAMQDLADITDSLITVITKSIMNVISVSDARQLYVEKLATDLVSAGSSGTLTMQDYCDITYFLEDYVGTSRTFT
jgi:hypothetical protein